MSNKFRINDIHTINAPASIGNLSRRDKLTAMKKAFDVTDSAQRGIIVTIDMSHSGRHYNNRIYTPWGQKLGVDSWTTPYAKPMIKNHDLDSEPIGRIRSVQYLDTPDVAKSYLKKAGYSDRDYQILSDALQSKDGKKIYNVMSRYGLLGNQDWPGVGVLRSKIRVTDEESVQKWLDERYLTVSVGSTSDMYLCGVCGVDWKSADGPCEHRPGEITDSGKIGTLILGKFLGREISVINQPADNLGFVQSIEFDDNESGDVTYSIPEIRSKEVSVTDSEFSLLGDIPMLNVFEKDVRVLVSDAWDGGNELSDALGETVTDKLWLIRVHDALHGEHDWRLRYSSEDNKEIPTNIFALHVKLMEMADAQGWRGDIVNGKLDDYDAEGKRSETPSSESMDSEANAEIPTAEDSSKDEEVPAPVAEKKEVDIAIRMADALIRKAYAVSEDSIERYAFPEDKMIPLTSKDQALELRDMFKDANQTEMISAIESYIADKSHVCVKCSEIKSQHDSLVNDHAELIKASSVNVEAIRNLNEKLTQAVDKAFELLNLSSEDTELDSKYERLIKMQAVDRSSLQPVENPLAGTDTSKDSLSSFEKSVKDRYHTILKESSKESADQYLAMNRRYLSRNFSVN